ncbi:UDP-N-acetylmuramoyl-tripeptide--D-alanyl-D-alanine ligase [Chlorobium phaeobacteroides]|uniref:UDP-N-acetylmuramoyl-tripeptide--D-alanyl-D-alanine ligase n=1 Tax=Chlorobium phaeobacteroides (strain DSM 266 / SMG 266 / 2430) TaxID=290317 RepID=A1BJY2_CHLPD|nr:UDP-N-acetylmuramoyl-tripeptide--D-alanyl-D-alanine ligase [Chlorobium phaeobacteroides]ABL66709.1 UDP-N-acetylmuramoyl-tripeptide--D-alanyl-D-alanine ligase [Chlorobium phaeobacteroides DSM 266]
MQGVLNIEELSLKFPVTVAGNGDVRGIVTDPVVVIDSRAVVDGAIFVALQGEHTDGHQYIDEVFAKGAHWAMVKKAWYESEGAPAAPEGCGFLVVEDPVAGLQRLAAIYRQTFSIPVIAVGGSNGKTTTKEMVAAVLGTGFTVQTSKGNLNNHLGVPLTLLQLRRQTGIAVVEMGINHPGEMELLLELARPTHGLLTNIGHEHLEFLLNLEGVAAEETRLFRYLQQHGGTCFVNADDLWLKEAAEGLTGSFTYGTADDSQIACQARHIAVDRSGRVSFEFVSGGLSERIALHFIGKHNVINALAAAAVGTYFGLSLEQIKKGLEALRPSPGWKRLEVQDAGGVVLINDTYNANSDSMRLAIDALVDIPCSGKKIAVLGDMLELGEAGIVEHEKTGRYIQQSPIDLLFTYGRHARLYGIEAGARCHGHYENRQKLLDELKMVVQPGDAVLFKASRSMRLELVVEALIKERTTM